MSNAVSITINGKDNASGIIGGVTGALGGLGNIAAGALSVALGNILTGALNAVGGALKSVFTEAIEAQKITAQLEAVLKSTGGAAGVTKNQALDLADSLSRVSTFSDDAILQGENLLLTFTNIGKDVFPETTQAMLDMATAMGTDAKSGAIQLGKALNDPSKGITALTRVGVTFTDQQKKMITTLQASGDIMGAQKIILAELAKEFGGSALAASKTFSGQMEVIKNRLLNVAEAIGTQLLPIMSGFLDNVITPMLPRIEKLASIFSDFIGGLLRGSDIFFSVANALQRVMLVLGFTGDQAKVAKEFILGLGTAFDTAIVSVSGFLPAIQPVIDAVVNLGQVFVDSLPKIQETVQTMVNFVIGQFNILSPTLITNVSTTLNNLAQFWSTWGDEIMAVVSVAFQLIAATIGVALTLASGIIVQFTNLATGNWQAFGQTMQSTFAAAMNAILAIAGTNLSAFAASWAGTWSLAQTILSTAWATMQGLATSAVSGLSSTVIGLIVGLVNSIRAAFAIDWASVGTSIIQGIIGGIAGAVGGLAIEAANAAAAALKAAQDALGISSPSKAFAEVGKNIMAGMEQGITKNVGLATGAATSAAQAVTGAMATSAVPPSFTAPQAQADSSSPSADMRKVIELLSIIAGNTGVKGSAIPGSGNVNRLGSSAPAVAGAF